MNRLLLAQEGYRRLSKLLETTLTEETSDQAEAWLRDELCPVVEELVFNRSFRSAAQWTLDHLAPGSEEPERQLVQDVDCAIIEYARALEAVTVGNGGESPVGNDRALVRVEIPAEDRATIQMITSRPWFDLVCAEEYFDAYRDLHLNPDWDTKTLGRKHTSAFRRRKELRIPLGDYVARTLFARIEYWMAILDKLWKEVFPKLPPGTGDAIKPHNRLFSAKLRLDEVVAALIRECNSGEAAKRRNACVALTLAYVGYSSVPNLDWLDHPQGWDNAAPAVIRSYVRRSGHVSEAKRLADGRLRIVKTTRASLCDPDVLRHLSAALHDVRPLFDIPEDRDGMVAWANDRARLVMVDYLPRTVYWEGIVVAEEEWNDHPNEWNLLWVLARHAQRLVTRSRLSNPDKHAIRSRRARLKRMLADSTELDNLIEAKRGTGGYQLDLSPGDICLLEDDGHGGLQQVRRNRSDT